MTQWLADDSARSHFFFNDTATTAIYTLSLHDALPIFSAVNSMILTFEWLESFMGSLLPDAGTETRMPSARMLTRRPLMRPARVLRIESFATTISGGPGWEP